MINKKPFVFTSRFVPWLYLLPTIVILLIFLYYPAIKSLTIAFYRSNFFLGTQAFIGTGNFKELFTGPYAPAFIQIIVQTAAFTCCVVCIGIGFSLCLAVLSNKKIRGAKIYRILLIWPFALSPAVAGTIYTFIFNPEVGIVNEVLGSLFNIKPQWLSAPLPAFIVCIAAAVWKNTGYNIVFYLAALQNIAPEPLEAAELDGATGFMKFRYVMLPLLSPTTFFLVLTNITYSFFDSFGIIDVLTRGAPVGAAPFNNAGVTTTLMYNVYLEGFGGSSNMGLAGAQSAILMSIVAVVAAFQFGLFGKKVNYDD
jgi:sn-glycerol 3-phosphate transport system permease protein